MRTRLVLPGLLLWAAVLPAHAAVNLQVVQCSGALQRSDEPAVSLSCEGDLQLHSGLIESGAEVTLAATQSIVLQDVTIRSQTITLQANAIVMVGNNMLDAPQLPVFQSPTQSVDPVVTVAQGALLTITAPVLSPPQSASALAGLVAGAGVNTVSLSGATLTVTAAEPVDEGGGSLSFAWLAGLALAVAGLNAARAPRGVRESSTAPLH